MGSPDEVHSCSVPSCDAEAKPKSGTKLRPLQVKTIQVYLHSTARCWQLTHCRTLTNC